jgi:uncharacterized protein
MLYPKMRRKDREMSKESAIKFIKNSDYAILSLCTDNMPYGVPLSTVYSDNKIYFHCAHEGFKIDIINENPYGHFVFISYDKVVPKEATVSYDSAMAHGNLRFVTETKERQLAFKLLIAKYMKAYITEGNKSVKKSDKATTIIAMDIKDMSAKSSRKD